jgi:hypothetical protein
MRKRFYFRRRSYSGFAIGVSCIWSARVLCINLLLWTLDISFQRRKEVPR